MKRKLISFVIPALNEEEGVRDTIISIPRGDLQKKGFDVEIIIVDGGSADKTVELAEDLGVLVISSRRGYGRQYKEGFKVARGDFIVTGDSDGTYPFEDIAFYLDYVEKNKKDFATINRFAEMEPGAMSFLNKIGNFGLTFFTDILFGLYLKDSQSGMWIIKRVVIKKLNLISDGMPFSQEIKIEAFRKLRSIEIDGRYKKRLGETKLLKVKDGFGNLFALFKKRFSF